MSDYNGDTDYTKPLAPQVALTLRDAAMTTAQADRRHLMTDWVYSTRHHAHISRCLVCGRDMWESRGIGDSCVGPALEKTCNLARRQLLDPHI